VAGNEGAWGRGKFGGAGCRYGVLKKGFPENEGRPPMPEGTVETIQGPRNLSPIGEGMAENKTPKGSPDPTGGTSIKGTQTEKIEKISPKFT